MGKSRLIHQVGYQRIVIPICLREMRSTGFPPRDANVCNFFSDAELRGRREAFLASHAFLTSLFESLRALLFGADSRLDERTQHENFRECKSYEDMATRFLRFMSDGGNIMSRTKTELDSLLEKIDQLADVPTENTIIIAFDAAHNIATFRRDSTTGEMWSIFGELRRALRSLTQHGLYSVFISITESADQLTPSPHDDDPSSSREDDTFIDVGLDHLVIPYDQYTDPQISDVVRLDRIIRMGRPLFATRYKYGLMDVRMEIIYFAVEKLLNKPYSYVVANPLTISQKLACLSARLALEYEQNIRALQEGRNQVARHMRAVLFPASDRRNMVTISPSEPVIAEAARLVFTVFDAPRALLELVRYSYVRVGDRGGVVIRLLLLLACDRKSYPTSYTALEKLSYVMVPDFLEELWPGCNVSQAQPTFVSFAEGVEEPLAWPHRRQEPAPTLGEAFKDAKIFFNHFIQLPEEGPVNRKYLCNLMMRGAAAICCPRQSEIKIIIPVLFDGQTLQHERITAIVIQVTLDPSDGVVAPLFDCIDPVARGIFGPMQYKPPVIRVVLALAAQGEDLSTGPFNPDSASSEAFTAYDILSAGIAKFGPITRGDRSVWGELLDVVLGRGTKFAAKQRDSVVYR
ncbi:hypothetical protein WOLCODRAFT_141446 [Wolfiporia cocos MD-104 SS10]|uniref:Uncharacterized protein n=1 Tax=Wolfiporia cocos (strain MD-104) TaxID=742152 RepID=A0A2H3ISN5_WOLCO|nr:hypothetical protein WOLCODRAFT_141446 [Wolfiporia cocos MD-104 SS10]